ncbi:MAG: hypothetical protein AAFP84_13485 [Actinomycetota bacterium]
MTTSELQDLPGIDAGVGDVAQLRGALIRLTLHISGRADDGFVRSLRSEATGGDVGLAGRSLAWAVLDGRVVLPIDAALLLGMVLDATDPRPGLSDALLAVSSDTAIDGSPSFRFESLDVAAPTVASAIGVAAATDGVLAVWQVQRVPALDVSWPRPVVVCAVEVADDADSVAIGAAFDGALAESGAVEPMIEVFVTGSETPPTLQAAVAAAPPIWAVAGVDDPQVAPVFDEVVDGVGRFAGDHPLVEQRSRAGLAEALDAGHPLVDGPATLPDVVDPAAGPVVPTTLRTDGTWIWSDAARYYLVEHGLAPHGPLVEHLRTRGHAPDRLSMFTLQRAADLVVGPDDRRPA